MTKLDRYFEFDTLVFPKTIIVTHLIVTIFLAIAIVGSLIGMFANKYMFFVALILAAFYGVFRLWSESVLVQFLILEELKR